MYDNSEAWERYKKSSLRKFIHEFRTFLKEQDEVLVFDEVKNLEFKSAVNYLKTQFCSEEPIRKLRSRFRTFAYKQRKSIINISVSAETKSKLDYILKKCSYADHSDLLESILNLSETEDEELISAIEEVNMKLN